MTEQGNRKNGLGITKSLILSATTITKNRSQTMDNYLSHITHLHLQSRKLRAIENLEHCVNLKVLYLYDNKIEEIARLDFAKGLRYLYLENNCIKEIPDLNNTKLKKLFLDENEIPLIRGLHQCSELVVLSVARQRLPRHKFLTFDPISLDVISHTLEVLDISGNSISSLAPFKCLYQLTKLLASDNNISDVGEIEGIVSLPHLEEINFLRNPCCSLRRYRDFVIGAASNSLRLFDDIPITQKNIDSVRGIQKLRRRIGLVDRSHATIGSSSRYDDLQSFEEHREDYNNNNNNNNNGGYNNSGKGGNSQIVHDSRNNSSRHNVNSSPYSSSSLSQSPSMISSTSPLLTTGGISIGSGSGSGLITGISSSTGLLPSHQLIPNQRRPSFPTSNTETRPRSNSNDSPASTKGSIEIIEREELSDEAISRRVKSIVEEYLSIKDVSEVCECLIELPESAYGQFVNFIIAKYLDCGKLEIQNDLLLLIRTVMPQLSSAREYIEESITNCEPLIFLVDSIMDIKQAPELLGKVVSELLVGQACRRQVIDETLTQIRNQNLSDEFGRSDDEVVAIHNRFLSVLPSC